jgi:uncharacterized membrane protein
MRNTTRSHIYLPIAAMIVTAPLAVPAAVQNQVPFEGTTEASALTFDFAPIDVPGASFTLARGINPQGDIVGFYSAGVTTPGFLLHEGTFISIDVPGASFTRPRGINAQGDIVGFHGAGGVTHGFLLDKEGSFTTIDVPGGSSTMAFGINPRGDIVGNYSAGGTNHGFLAQR